jgi:hypothetical protein
MWGKKLFLHPEEALYLVDRANLLLFEDTPAAGKRLLSLQECQELMIETGVSMDMFVVYCKLVRAGYIVQRHPFTWVVKNSESPTQIWGPPNSYHSTTNRLGQAAGISTDTLANKTDVSGVKEKEVEEERAAKRQRKQKPVKNEKKEESAGSWWGNTTKTTSDTNNATTNNATNKATRNPWAGLVDQTKLPRCTVRQPALHRALALFPNMQPLHHLQPSEVVDLSTANKEGVGMLHFDVFAANSQFSRKYPDLPLYSICVCGGGSPPSVLANNAADLASNGVPVRYSGVEHGDISYFAIARSELHKIFRD